MQYWGQSRHNCTYLPLRGKNVQNKEMNVICKDIFLTFYHSINNFLKCRTRLIYRSKRSTRRVTAQLAKSVKRKLRKTFWEWLSWCKAINSTGKRQTGFTTRWAMFLFHYLYVIIYKEAIHGVLSFFWRPVFLGSSSSKRRIWGVWPWKLTMGGSGKS